MLGEGLKEANKYSRHMFAATGLCVMVKAVIYVWHRKRWNSKVLSLLAASSLAFGRTMIFDIHLSIKIHQHLMASWAYWSKGVTVSFYEGNLPHFSVATFLFRHRFLQLTFSGRRIVGTSERNKKLVVKRMPWHVRSRMHVVKHFDRSSSEAGRSRKLVKSQEWPFVGFFH